MHEFENSACVTDPPEMMQFLLWTTLAVFGIVYILLGKSQVLFLLFHCDYYYYYLAVISHRHY